MYGDVIDEKKGEGGFGYDPIFIPTNYETTLGLMDPLIKEKIGHRAMALGLAMKIVTTILK
jgi:XTP/dITP diphosphohydrolase